MGDRQRRAGEIFRDVCRLPESEREAHIEKACEGDEGLRRLVTLLLKHDSEPNAAIDALDSGGAVVAIEKEMTPEIDGFEIGSLLGRGGMGAVYEAVQLEPSRRVAIKIIHMPTPELRARFLRETEAIARLNHPGIASVHASGVAPSGHGYLVMELIEGQSLVEATRDRPLDEVLYVLERVVEGVHHAHVKGVIHCDLKPANVLVAEGRPRVVDFGIARLVDEGEGQTIEQAIGTPAYMSPEQVQGRRRDLDARTDVYALGVMIHEVLAGSLPYQADWSSMYDASRTICERAPTTLPSSLPRDLDAVVRKALEKDPERRYQSAMALASDLSAVRERRPVQAAPPSAVHQARLFATRHRALVGALAVAVLAVVLGLVGTTAFAIRASQLREIAEAERDDARDARNEADREREIALEAKRDAEIERQRADQRFSQVRSLATTLLFDIEGMLRYIGGATPARERLVEVGLEYLENLAADVDDDSILLDELSRGYLQVAIVQGAPTGSSLGDTEGGLRSLEKAIDLRTRQIELEGADPRVVLWQTAMFKIRSEFLQQLGRTEDALASVDEAMRIGMALLDEEPRNPTFMRDVALSHAARASIENLSGQFEDSILSTRRSISLLEQFLEQVPGDARVERDLNVERNQLAGTFLELGRAEEALEVLDDVLVSREAALRRAPHDVRAASDVAGVLSRIGKAYLQLDRPEDAIEVHQRQLEIFETIVRDDPENASRRYDLSISHEKLGDARRQAGHLEDALDSYVLAESIRRELLDLDPENVQRLASIVTAIQRRGQILRLLGRPEEAAPILREAIRLGKDVIERDRANLLGWSMTMASLNELGLALEGRDDVEALEAFRECRALELQFRTTGMTRPPLAYDPGDIDDAIRRLESK